ncbi:hypothetical protein [Paludisphaera mucosa]|uniref:Uncharacterized protein n=1 Tax=Paludisphaera mucosa TaxID=3030827 RepID=A0ABT6F8K6_9BACT|nr:hypothetical protein [Paludisphaera mucosa]MDG3003924.1 hypothetical protein [Paludisphaera mucosa]
MSAETTLTIELIRWTFTVDPAHRGEIETYLLDQGLEVLVRGEETMVATWDEPEGEIEEVIEGMWAINGSPFEVTHEEFHRSNLLLYDADEETKAVA